MDELSLEEVAIKLMKEELLYDEAIWVKEKAVYIPGKRPMIVSDFKNMEDSLVQSRKDVDKGPEERKVFSLERKEKYQIPTSRFYFNFTRFLFKRHAREFGEYLFENNMDNLYIILAGKYHTQALVSKIWFRAKGTRNGQAVLHCNTYF